MGANFLPSAATQFTTASTAAKTPGDGASSANLALAPVPCSGPECQGAPRGRLPLPLSLAPPKGADRWAFDKREPPEASQAASWRWIESILLVLSDGFSLLPERPPKVS
jgi:hypothetical protein